MMISIASWKVRRGVMVFVAVAVLLLTGTAAARADEPAPVTSVSVRVEGNEKTAAEMLKRLRTRGARKGITVAEGDRASQLRILVFARGPQWQQVFGISASGAVAVLDANGELLFMHIRQKEPTVGIAIEEMADEILRHLPALLDGQKLLTS